MAALLVRRRGTGLGAVRRLTTAAGRQIEREGVVGLTAPEAIIGKLREAEVLLAQGKKVGEVCRSIGVTEQTYYRWRNEYGGLKVDQARRLKELERENARLRKAVSDLTLDKMILKEAASGNF